MAGTESNIKDREHEDSPFVNNKKKDATDPTEPVAHMQNRQIAAGFISPYTFSRHFCP